jgi:hypothetical protein
MYFKKIKKSKFLPAKFMIIVWICQAGWVLQNFSDSRHELIEKLSAFGIVEERPSNRGDLYKTGQGQGRQSDWQRRVEVEEQLQRAELKERGSPTCGNLERPNTVSVFNTYYKIIRSRIK